MISHQTVHKGIPLIQLLYHEQRLDGFSPPVRVIAQEIELIRSVVAESCFFQKPVKFVQCSVKITDHISGHGLRSLALPIVSMILSSHKKI